MIPSQPNRPNPLSDHQVHPVVALQRYRHSCRNVKACNYCNNDFWTYQDHYGGEDEDWSEMSTGSLIVMPGCTATFFERPFFEGDLYEFGPGRCLQATSPVPNMPTWSCFIFQGCTPLLTHPMTTILTMTALTTIMDWSAAASKSSWNVSPKMVRWHFLHKGEVKYSAQVGVIMSCWNYLIHCVEPLNHHVLFSFVSEFPPTVLIVLMTNIRH